MSIYDFNVRNIDGKEVSLEEYRGKVMLIVNVASKCHYVNQYRGLQKLHEKYGEKGLKILGFPCNQFLSQEPGTEEEIKLFCSSNFGISFDMFAKISVNGSKTEPLYVYLKNEAPGTLTNAIKWNFTKFLVDRDGKVLKRYAPSTSPEEIESDIEKLL
ncbi:MAG: glutathione peroxidase [Campylobacterales bacterium]|nr:glutathione peroxidase [Campylobacterales bacterium]